MLTIHLIVPLHVFVVVDIHSPSRNIFLSFLSKSMDILGQLSATVNFVDLLEVERDANAPSVFWIGIISTTNSSSKWLIDDSFCAGISAAAIVLTFLSISICHVCCHKLIDTLMNDRHCRELFVSVLSISIRHFCCHESINTSTNKQHCWDFFAKGWVEPFENLYTMDATTN